MGDKQGHPFRGNQYTSAETWAREISKDWNEGAKVQILRGAALSGGPREGNPHPLTARHPESDGPLPTDAPGQVAVFKYYRDDAADLPFTAADIGEKLNVGPSESKEIAERWEKEGLLTKHDVTTRWDTARGRSGTGFDRVNVQMKRKVQRYRLSGWTPAQKLDARSAPRRPTE